MAVINVAFAEVVIMLLTPYLKAYNGNPSPLNVQVILSLLLFITVTS